MSDQHSADSEYDALRNYAWHNGFFAQIHRNFDPLLQWPGREDACWYLQRQKKDGGESILKYRTAAEVRAWIDDYRRDQ
jgi:hypothetical protein